MKSGIVSVDIGGSHITAVMLDGQKMLTPFLSEKVDSHAIKTEIINTWWQCIGRVISMSPTFFSGKVAIAIPSPFDYENGIALFPVGVKYAALHGLKIGDALNVFSPQKIDFFFENDAACFALGEAYFGKTKPFEKSMAITLGTGIGCAFIKNKKVIKSGDEVPSGGEIYHLPYSNGIADEYFSTRWFVREVEVNYGQKIKGVRELVEAEDEEMKAKIFSRFSMNIYDFLMPIATKFGAEAIFFGGNISKAWSWFSEYLSQRFSAHNISVFQSTLNEKAICLGAQMAMKNAASSDI